MLLHQFRRIFNSITCITLFAATCAGCHHAVLGKPVIVGASASSGVGASIDSIPVDLESVYDSVVIAPHQQPLNLASGFQFASPVQGAIEQLEIASNAKPTCIIALDLLFWPAHQTDSRISSIDTVLSALSKFDVPIVLGLIPAIDPERVSLISNERIPSNDVRRKLNAHISTWAASHTNVLLVDLDKVRDESLQPVELLIQSDSLHPTTEGLIELMQSACLEMQHKNLIEPQDWEPDVDLALKTLPVLASKAAKQKMGSLSYSDLSRRQDEMDDAQDEQDCEAVFTLQNAVLADFAALSMKPKRWDKLKWYVYSMPFGECKEAELDAYAKQVERLAVEVAIDNPNPWKLELWVLALLELHSYEEIVDRMLILRQKTEVMDDRYRPLLVHLVGWSTNWRNAPEDFFTLLPKVHRALWVNAVLKEKTGIEEPLSDTIKLFKPESNTMFNIRMDCWNNRLVLDDKVKFPDPPRPVRGKMWTTKARKYVYFLEDSFVIADVVHSNGFSAVAKQLKQLTVETIGIRVYEAFLKVLIEKPSGFFGSLNYGNLQFPPLDEHGTLLFEQELAP